MRAITTDRKARPSCTAGCKCGGSRRARTSGAMAKLARMQWRNVVRIGTGWTGTSRAMAPGLPAKRRMASRECARSGNQLLQQLAQLGRPFQRLAERDEIALVHDQGHALEAAGVVVHAEADLVRALGLAVGELQ